jgi:hypothetical protein
MAPPTLAECAAIRGRVDASLRGWTPTTDTARADALDGLEVLQVLDATEAPPPRFDELYTSPIDAAEDIALVRDTLSDVAGAGYRRDLIRAAAGLVRSALRRHVAPPISDHSTAHSDLTPADGAAVRAATGGR